jgi:hypothetical protein
MSCLPTYTLGHRNCRRRGIFEVGACQEAIGDAHEHRNSRRELTLVESIEGMNKS